MISYCDVIIIGAMLLTPHRHLSEVMLREIGHIPGPELEFADDREAYPESLHTSRPCSICCSHGNLQSKLAPPTRSFTSYGGGLGSIPRFEICSTDTRSPRQGGEGGLCAPRNVLLLQQLTFQWVGTFQLSSAYALGRVSFPRPLHK